MTAPNFPPQVTDFKAQFPREFPYGTGLDFVTDGDILSAIAEAWILFNPGLWDCTTPIGRSSEASIAYNYLAAHVMVIKIQQMAGGLSATPRGKGTRNSAEGVVVASGVGAANVSYQVPPPRVAENAVLMDLFRTTFGQRYMAMIEPRLVGNIMVVSGYTDGGLGNPGQFQDPRALV